MMLNYLFLKILWKDHSNKILIAHTHSAKEFAHNFPFARWVDPSWMRATSWRPATQLYGLVGYLDAVLKTLNCIRKEHVSLQYAYLLKLPDQEAIIQSLEMVLNHEHFKNIEWHQAFPLNRMLWNKESPAEGRAKNHKSVESEQQATKPQLGQRVNKRWGQHTNKNKREWQYSISNLWFKINYF